MAREGTARRAPLCIQDQAVPLCVVKRETIFLLQHHVGLGPPEPAGVLTEIQYFL